MQSELLNRGKCVISAMQLYSFFQFKDRTFDLTVMTRDKQLTLKKRSSVIILKI